jgi:hypothetical protein
MDDLGDSPVVPLDGSDSIVPHELHGVGVPHEVGGVPPDFLGGGLKLGVDRGSSPIKSHFFKWSQNHF